MASLHYFNPGSEAAILHASPYYTPTANLLKMQRDLAFLPAWYADSPNDYVWIENSLPEEFVPMIKSFSHLAKTVCFEDLINQKQELTGLEISPWGISPQSLRFFEILNDKHDLGLIIPKWKEEYSRLCSRETANKCLEFIIQSHPEIEKNIVPTFCTNIEGIENLTQTSRHLLLAKAPYSSSGRGLLWLPPGNLHQSEKQIISGILKKQGFVSIEKALDKRVDFAMLFHSDGFGKIKYTGLSLFETNKKGAYNKNIIASQHEIQDKLKAFIDILLLEKVKNAILQFLSYHFNFIYKGCIGVDMMVYSEKAFFRLHPCVEINMRNTMGMLAFQLHQHFFCENTAGYFKIDFSNNPDELLQKHWEMVKLHPAEFSNGKLKSGYVSLCPIKKDSKYRAYIHVECK